MFISFPLVKEVVEAQLDLLGGYRTSDHYHHKERQTRRCGILEPAAYWPRWLKPASAPALDSPSYHMENMEEGRDILDSCHPVSDPA